ncbi:Cerato-platanin [Punctularia strigosozonata HHB-11173 SS5]|uniref:Cerato-platanin n=1 Tax=Punctularia strigosozonata (strain HHB-11173) TaxID=741275 RepID=UPI0004416968|nr:Cerato-platanin [Punctularia strigosozonata HHB-11173 SS5]EIN07913.1 Cerato-platanin [Punctularia strigosozonata HHB-11173 SS5]
MKFTNVFATLALAFSARAVVVTYDNTYDNPNGSLDSVACSNGANGLETRFGWETFNQIPHFPYIGGGAPVAGWNSTNCGTCWNLAYAGTGKSINVVLIDTAFGFNIAQEALDDLTDGQAVAKGHFDVTATQVSAVSCGLRGPKWWV